MINPFRTTNRPEVVTCVASKMGLCLMTEESHPGLHRVCTVVPVHYTRRCRPTQRSLSLGPGLETQPSNPPPLSVIPPDVSPSLSPRIWTPHLPICRHKIHLFYGTCFRISHLFLVLKSFDLLKSQRPNLGHYTHPFTPGWDPTAE